MKKTNKINKINNFKEENIMKKFNNAQEIANYLEANAYTKGLIDVSDGATKMLGVTDDELKKAIGILEEKGYFLTEFDVLVKEDAETE